MAKSPKTKYFYALGRRKTSIATIRLFPVKGESLINEKKPEQIYSSPRYLKELHKPFEATQNEGKYHFHGKVKGGGRAGQLSALRLAIARSLVKVDKSYREILKKEHLLTVDDRKKERKKPGLKKARKKEQFSKR